MRARNVKLNVYLNRDEKRLLDKKSEKTGLTNSALIRFLIEDFEPKEKPPIEFYESLNGIRKVGNVINQMVARTYHLGYIEDENFLRKTLANLNDLILNIKEYYLVPDKINKDNAN